MTMLRHVVKRTQLRIIRLLRRGAATTTAAEARGRNVVVGPTFTYHIVSRPGEILEPLSGRRLG